MAAESTVGLAPLGPEIRVGDAATDTFCPRLAGRADRSFLLARPTDAGLVAQHYDGAAMPVGPQTLLEAPRVFPADLTVENRPAGLGEIVTWGVRTFTGAQFKRWEPTDGFVRMVNGLTYSSLMPRRVGGYLSLRLAARGDVLVGELLDDAGRPTGRSFRFKGAYVTDVAHADDGSFTILYAGYPDGTNRTFLRRYDRFGRPLSAEVVAFRGQYAVGARLESAPDGRTAVVWVDQQLAGSDLTGTIYIRFFKADGSPATGALRVDAIRNPSLSFAPESLAVDRDGRALIVWSHIDVTPEIARYSVQLWTPAGAASPVLDLAAEPIDQRGAQLCVDTTAAGRTWVVVWRALGSDGTMAVFLRRFFSAL